MIDKCGPVAHRMTQGAFGRLQALGTRPLPVDSEHCHRTGDRLPVTLSFARHEVIGIGELRWTTLTSPRVDIAAIMVFPHDPESLPVFAAEFVVMGGRCRAAVVDLQPVTTDPANRQRQTVGLGEIGAPYAALRAAVLPDWCAAHFTPHAIAALGVDLEEIDFLMDGYDRFLDHFARTCGQAPRSGPTDHPELAEYKCHHIEHTPGRPFMSAAFGADWTEDFLRRGMYS